MAFANRNTIPCPHCGGPVRTQTSRQLSPLCREIYYECLDVECGHRFVAHLGVVRTLVPSLMPRADVVLPIVERRRNDIVMAPSSAAEPVVSHLAASPSAHRDLRMTLN